MSKTLKVSDDVYHDLDQFRYKGDTFSDALERVLKCANTILTVKMVLGPSHYLMSDRPPGKPVD